MPLTGKTETGRGRSAEDRATACGTKAAEVTLHASPHPAKPTHLVLWHLDVQVRVRHYNRHRLHHVLHNVAAGYGHRAQL